MTIRGLQIVPDFISEEEERDLLEAIQSQPWNRSLKRLTQHYGFEYKYTGYTLNPASPIPDFLMPIKSRIETTTGKVYDMVIVNRYMSREGISPHIDHVRLFGDTVVSLSLGSSAMMRFERGHEQKDVMLTQRSVAILQEDARYRWKHSIPPVREMRISVTFRKVSE
jgi:alkylated DNA repair dioxygenase AlkB